MAELRRRRTNTNMSEIGASEKELGECSGTVVDSSECTADAVQNKAEEERTLELQTEEEGTTLELAGVDVTVESNDSESISSSTAEYESCKSQVSEGSSGEINDSSIDKDSDDREDEDEDVNEDGTVTCALLGLEQAKVSFTCLTLYVVQISDLFFVLIAIVKVKFVTDAC